jgi:hypothetical protein
MMTNNLTNPRRARQDPARTPWAKIVCNGKDFNFLKEFMNDIATIEY